MIIDFTDINYLKDPDLSVIKADYEQFLLSLDGLTIIDITGRNTQRCRVLVTLMYGDEPSGLIALHRLFESMEVAGCPTNLRIIICSVEAASLTPLCTHRFVNETQQDINCLFGQPEAQEDEDVITRAHIIENKIREVSPEAILDMRNTLGSSPAFAFSHLVTPEILTLASFFTSTLVLTEVNKGTLLAQDFNCPMLRIECGESQDEQSHEIAYHGIKTFIHCPNLFEHRQDKDVKIIYKPMRFQVKEGKELTFAKHDEGEEGVTLKTNLDILNYGIAHPGQLIGWVDSHGLDNLQLLNDVNENVIEDYFYVRDSQLVVKKAIKVFMAHTRDALIKSRCVFYLVNA